MTGPHDDFRATPPATQAWAPPTPAAWGIGQGVSGPVGSGAPGATGGGPGPRRGWGRGRVLVVAGFAVLVLGGGATVAAVVAGSGSGAVTEGRAGASTPQVAVLRLAGDLGHSDLLGALNDLPPGERASLVGPFIAGVDNAKRLGTLDSTADPADVSGVTADVEAPTIDGGGDAISDDVQLLTLRGGSVAITADYAKLPFTTSFLDALFPGGPPRYADGTTTISLDGVRIAAQRVEGIWYASAAYTALSMIYTANGVSAPGASDAIAPDGAPSPEDAVKIAVGAYFRGDVAGMIAVSDPVEAAALHTWGRAIVAHDGNATTFSGRSYGGLVDADLGRRTVAGGVDLVTITSVTVNRDDQLTQVRVEDGCVHVRLY